MKDALEHLKTERLSRGWTLQDVSDRTGISITVLMALESGDSEKLISHFALEALMRKYSAAFKAQTEPAASKNTTERDGARARKIFPYIITGLFLCAVFTAVFLGTVFRQARETKVSSVKPQEPAVIQNEVAPLVTPEKKTLSGPEDLPLQHRELPEVEQQAPGPSPADDNASSVSKVEQDAVPPSEPDQTSVVSIQPPAGVRPIHLLEIVTDQRTWIQVVIDGESSETELLQAGETRKWQAMDKVDLVVGNGGGVRIQWDGKPVEISSGRGHVVRLTLPRS